MSNYTADQLICSSKQWFLYLQIKGAEPQFSSVSIMELCAFISFAK